MADLLIKSGFWVQVMLLGVVDVGTVIAVRRDPESWPHLVGLVLVNAALIPVAVLVWRWMRAQRTLVGPRRDGSA